MINNVDLIRDMYYSNFATDVLQKELMKEIDPSITLVKKEFQAIFEKMIKKDPCLYWDKAVFIQTRDTLEKIFEDMQDSISLSDLGVYNFIMGYNSYCQLTGTILNLQHWNLSAEIKTRLYRIPTYTTLVESCMSNFLRTIAAFLGKATGKDYTKQQKLGPLLEVMKSNGLTEIAQKIDVNIRNAINHGKISLQKTPQDEINFFYMEQGIAKVKKIPVYEFDRIINNTYDTVSAVLLAIVVFMNRHITVTNEEYSKGNYTAFALLAMSISLPGIICQSISDVPNKKQINIEMSVKNTDQTYLAALSIEIGIIIFSIYNDYEKYMIFFQNPRLGICWARYKKEELSSVLDDLKNMAIIYKNAIKKMEFVYYKPDNENVDINAEKYFCFPNYESDVIKINQVTDASVKDRKRLKANLFVGNISNKKEIMAALDEAVSWLKYVKNPPCAKFPHKYGDMEADALYINVYHKDTRGNKALLPNNTNFICFLDYNLNGCTTLLHGGLPSSIWEKLYHEKNGKYDIAWRESKYITRTVAKVGVNTPCTYSSGKKFKKKL